MHTSGLGWGTFIEFYEPRHNLELKVSHEEAAPRAQAEWCDLHCKWLRGRFQKWVYPEADSLNGPDHLGQSVKSGGLREGEGRRGEATSDRSPRTKTDSAGSVTRSDTKKPKRSVESEISMQPGGARWTWSLLTHWEATTLPYSANERWQSLFDLTSSRWLLRETPKLICIIKNCSIREGPKQRFSDSNCITEE